MMQTDLADDTVLVVGAGYLGRRYLERCSPDTAIGLSRSGGSSSRLVAVFDLDSDDALPVALPDRYSVLYTVPPSSESMSDVRLRRLLPLLLPVPRRFVYISTTGVYGNHKGASVDETTPVNPESERARRRVAAEELLQTWASTNSCDVVILRVPGIYGPGRLGTERIAQGSPVIAEEDAGPGNRIHVGDLVRCCEAALSKGAPAGIYNVGDGDNRTSTWFSNEVARQCGLPPPPTIAMSEAEQQFSPMRMSFLRESRLVDTRKMRDVLGVKLRFPNSEEGIRSSLDEQRGTP